MAARGLGAVWITTCFCGSSMAAQTSSVGSLARRAPVGQLAAIDADHLGQRLVHEGRDLGAAAPADGLQHADLLQVDAGADAAPAEHALVHVADHGVAGAVDLVAALLQVAEAEEIHAVFHGQRLKLAVLVAAAGVAFAVVIG
jgi:hypothetical protein